jgi:hypothetical protein
LNFKSESFKEFSWMDELGVKELGEKVWAKEIQLKTNP